MWVGGIMEWEYTNLMGWWSELESYFLVLVNCRGKSPSTKSWSIWQTPNICYAATTNGLFVLTVNAEVTWTKVINSSVADMELKPGRSFCGGAVTDDYWGFRIIHFDPVQPESDFSFATAWNAIETGCVTLLIRISGCFATNNMSLYVSPHLEPPFSRQTNPPGFAAVFCFSHRVRTLCTVAQLPFRNLTMEEMTWQQHRLVHLVPIRSVCGFAQHQLESFTSTGSLF